MAEIAGLVIGGVSLVALYDSCRKCFDVVSLAHHHGQDYERLAIKFNLVKMRFAIWGETMQLSQLAEATAVPPTSPSQALARNWDMVKDSVGNSLAAIKSIFEDRTKLEAKYGMKQAPSAMISTSFPTSLAEVEKALQMRSAWRQSKTSLVQKSAWVIRDRDGFQSLVSELMFFVENLENISQQIGVLHRQHDCFANQIRAIENPENIELLASTLETDSDQQANSHSAAGGRTCIGGHDYIHAIVSERATQVNGDVGLDSVPGRAGNRYEAPKAEGFALQANGAMSTHALEALLRARQSV